MTDERVSQLSGTCMNVCNESTCEKIGHVRCVGETTERWDGDFVLRLRLTLGRTCQFTRIQYPTVAHVQVK